MAKSKSKTNSSIIFRLNAHFLWERFSLFLAVDLLLCLFFTLAGFLFVEQQVSRIVEAAEVELAQEMDWEQEGLLAAAGYTLEWTDTAPEALPVADFFIIFLPDNTADGGRSFSIDRSAATLKNKVRSIAYTVTVPAESVPGAPETGDAPAERTGATETGDAPAERTGGAETGDAPQKTTNPPASGPVWLSVSAEAGPALYYFLLGGFLLLVWQALSLLMALFNNAREISKILKPLQELTETTRSLSAAGQLSPAQLQKLAGALDSINATRLDKRLPVDRLNDELQPLAAAINEMLSRIDESYRFQMRFVSDASHELRTPIAVIQGYANLLARWGTEDPDTLQESITAIKTEADSMKELVEQLLFLARGDNETMHLEWEPLDLAALAAAALKDTELIDHTHSFEGRFPGSTAATAPIPQTAPLPQAAATNPQTAAPQAAATAPQAAPAPIPQTAPLLIYADRGLIKQLLRILLDNSVKYTPDGGHITLSVSTDENQVLLTVQDDGIGIPPEALPHIFDRFYRADESRARETGGTGLGLSIAKWIVDRHQGYFDVTSRKDIGTRILVHFPVCKSGTDSL